MPARMAATTSNMRFLSWSSSWSNAAMVRRFISLEEWNSQHPIGTRVRITLADGQCRDTRTLSLAQTWGGLDHIQVGGIAGFVLLSWVLPREADVA